MIFINLDSFKVPSEVREREKEREKGENSLDIRFRRPGYGGFSWGSES